MKKETQRRLEKGRREALNRVAQRGVMQFRLDPESIEQLYGLASGKKRPVGTMVREWVLERIQEELSAESVRARVGERRANYQTAGKEGALIKRIEKVERRLEEVESSLATRARKT